MNIKFKETCEGCFLVSVTYNVLPFIGPEKSREYMLIAKGLSTAMVDTSTGEHQHGRIREKVEGKFKIWQALELGIIR